VLSLDEIIREPERVQELSEEEVRVMDYRLEAARAVLRRRLEVRLDPPAPNNNGHAPPADDRNLKLKEAAAFLGVSEGTLKKHLDWPISIKISRSRRYPLNLLREYRDRLAKPKRSG